MSAEPTFRAVTPGPRAAADGRGHGRGDVVDMDEVPPLPPVLEDRRRLPSGELGSEERRDAGVRRVAGHAGSVDVVEAQRRHRRRGLPAPRCAEMLAVHLGGGVDVAGIQRRRLEHEVRRQRSPTPRARRLEPARVQIGSVPSRRSYRPVLSAAVRTFAVDDHGRGVDDAPDPGLGRGPQHDRGAVVVAVGVVVDVADADTESYLGREMNDDVAAAAGESHPVEIADVVPVVEGDVEGDNVVVGGTQSLPCGRPDEAGAPGQQHLHDGLTPGMGDRKVELEATAAGDVAHPDAARVGLDHPAGDGQTES